MITVALPLATATAAGFLHALEADHVAAVTTFVAQRPRPRQALSFGVRWGVGHSLVLAAASAALLALDLRPPEGLERALEGAVGLLLIALGLRLLRTGGPTRAPARGHGTTWVGAAHGLAGTGAFLALLPVTLLGSPWLAGGYVLAFGLGTVLAMGAYALAAGLLFERVGGRGLVGLTALCSVAIGLVWVVRAEAGARMADVRPDPYGIGGGTMDPFLLGIAAAVALGYAVLWFVLRRAKMPPIEAAVRHPDVLVVDVRPPAAFREEHYPRATNVPLPDLRERAAELGAAGRPIVVYAEDAEKSAAAVRILRECGFARVLDAGNRDGMPSPRADVGFALFRRRPSHPR